MHAELSDGTDYPLLNSGLKIGKQSNRRIFKRKQKLLKAQTLRGVRRIEGNDRMKKYLILYIVRVGGYLLTQSDLDTFY